jgi:hypothetical protein
MYNQDDDLFLGHGTMYGSPASTSWAPEPYPNDTGGLAPRYVCSAEPTAALSNANITSRICTAAR